MSNKDLIKHIDSPFIQRFLKEYLSQLVRDVKVFSKEILANVPIEKKPSTKRAGFFFYITPILALVPENSWERIRAAIENGVWTVFCTKLNDHGEPKKAVLDVLNKDGMPDDLIEQAIITAFSSICESSGNGIEALRVEGVADLLGKFIALHIAEVLDEAVKNKFSQYSRFVPPALAGIKSAN